MPLINGQKMACEPCIRGHRSTKCTHASERLMVPVRRPGRPLSACPHPASRPCTCNAITAAIPRKQKCYCGTPSSVRADQEDNEEHIEPAPGLAATSSSSGSYRVEKPSRTFSSRKPSADLNALGRMDPAQINLLPGSNGTTSTPTNPPNGMAFQISRQAQDTHEPTANGHHHSMQPQHATFVKTESSSASSGTESRNTSLSESDAQADTSKGSCCGGQSEPETSRTAPTKATTPSPTNGTAKSSCVKSCCAPKSRAPQAGMPLPAFIPNGVHMNGVGMPGMQAPMMMATGPYPIFQQPTVFAYPPQLGSYMQPLQPEQWKQFMATMSFNQQMQAAQAAQMAQNNATAAMAAPVFNNSDETDTATLHECNCGPGCECVGCAAHPYNQATTDYVRSACGLMDPSKHRQSHTDGTNGQPSNYENGVMAPALETSAEGNAEAVASGTIRGDAVGSSSAAHTPSDTASLPEDQQQLSASDFFFVTYPFDDACVGDTSSCPCGDSCECIGCVIHNNPGPSNPTEGASERRST